MDLKNAPVLVAAFLGASASHAQSPAGAIERLYVRMEQAYCRKDTDAFLAFFAPTVASQSFAGGQAERSQLAPGLNNLFGQTEQLRMRYRVQSVQSAGTQAIVIVRSSRIILMKQDDRRVVREGTTDIRHTWKLMDGRWQIAGIERLGPPAYGRRANLSYYWI